jgi:hypothetical protein
MLDNLRISAHSCSTDIYFRNMINSDETQKSVMMPIKLYYNTQTNKILMGSEKAKADFSETLYFLKR